MESRARFVATTVARPTLSVSSRDDRPNRRVDFFADSTSRGTSADALHNEYSNARAKKLSNKMSNNHNSSEGDAPYRRDLRITTRASFIDRRDARSTRDALHNTHGYITSSLHNKEDGDCQLPGCGDAPLRRNGVALTRARPLSSLSLPLSRANRRPRIAATTNRSDGQHRVRRRRHHHFRVQRGRNLVERGTTRL